MDPAGLRPLGVGEILDVGIKIYRARFGVLVRAVAVVLGPVFALAAVIRISMPGDDNLFGVGQPGTTGELDSNALWTFAAGTLLITVLTFVASQVATGACFKSVGGAYLDEEPDWRESLRFARSRLGSLLWLSFLLVVFLAPAFVACLVPGMYLYTVWSVAAPVLLLEDVRGRGALKRSHGLVKGRFWSTAAVLLLMTVLTGIVQAIFLGLLAGIASVGDNEVGAALAQAIGQTVSSTLTTPLSAAVLTVLYFDLRVRKEGFDLELLAHRLGVDPASVPRAEPVVPPPRAPAPEPSGDQPPFWPPPPGWRPRDG